MGDDRLIKNAVNMQYHSRQEGDLLMDAPTSTSWEHLVKIVEDNKTWNKHVRRIKDMIHIESKKKKKMGNKKKTWLVVSGIDAGEITEDSSDCMQDEERV